MDEERIINLEIKFAHQDHYLDQLNKIVTEQQKTIDRLEKEILDLKRNMIASEGTVERTRSLKDDVPPHY